MNHQKRVTLSTGRGLKMAPFDSCFQNDATEIIVTYPTYNVGLERPTELKIRNPLDVGSNILIFYFASALSWKHNLET